ncbi:2-oxoacid:acceptor oxidoreductase subunit alpha [uncultured Methanoregula sp.]|uniref:2-oxoacid:acceptor oxidoreductase subunit alpha n=1 Tax=uncultured Methanoregula sp. TaxID=1005933 RepID=UPI002AABCF00|nr:2-oxoacid:acceptor oxidoreductase subunit alpha [uncultured Methanoregula sp.]
MKEVSVLVGGKAGDGINSAGAMVAQLLNHSGYRIYLYFDYPSLIRGGHNFAIIRGAEQDIGTCRETVDFVLALNQETVERHRSKWHPGTIVLFNSDLVKGPGHGIPIKEILSSENAPDIMGNSALTGAFAKAAGIDWETVNAVFTSHIPKGVELNLKVARRAYDLPGPVSPVGRGSAPAMPLITGNEAIGIGLIKGGLEAYVSYPMTPSSSLLHFLAGQNEAFGIQVIHPENEIAVVLMGLGFACAGKRAAVGTSGGGFCLMTEGLSFAGMAELPLVLVVSQRTGPSTGLPTYTGQSDLRLILHAGQGEFPRLIVAPGDVREAVYWSAVAMNLAWKFQVPAFILTDKTLSEGTYSLDLSGLPDVLLGDIPRWDGSATYHRYADSPSGVSPLAFPGTRDAVIKVNSYAHSELGITTEEGPDVAMMTEKRQRKWQGLADGMDQYPAVNILGASGSPTALLCWGSTKGVCTEVANVLGLRVVQPVVLSPFPVSQIRAALEGTGRIICVEENATGQLDELARQHGIIADMKILKYDGRPFTREELEGKVREALV